MMEVKVSRVHVLQDAKGKTRAFADVVVSGAVAIHGVRIIESEKGLFISFPAEKSEKDGRYYEVVHPVTKEAREAIRQAVLGEYQRQAQAARTGPGR